ncbi:MAG: hypothetical protein ACTSW1_03970 [Candidatus Hodarchaeales archaeon]
MSDKIGHGSQIITGMTALPAFKEANNGTEGLYDWNEGGTDGALDIDDYFVSGDLGNPDRITWANRTREYLDNPDHSDVNVVMWSWCGQVASATEDDINTYLTIMTELENEYQNITFVYMTGHTDGSGLDGNLHIRNEQIRNYCVSNDKILYDFEDIESYDPDGNYFGDKNVNDNCDYTGGNWAIEWQNNHTEGVDWYNCAPAHTQALNGNLKAYAAWWLWARLAGWADDTTTTETTDETTTETTSETTSSTSSESNTTETTTETKSTVTTSLNISSIPTSSNSSNTTWGFNLIIAVSAFIGILTSQRKHKK